MSGPQQTRCVALQLATVTSAGQAPWSLAETNRLNCCVADEQCLGILICGKPLEEFGTLRVRVPLKFLKSGNYACIRFLSAYAGF